MDLSYLYMALATFYMGMVIPTLLIGSLMARTPYMPNFSLLGLPQGPEDGPVVLGGAPGHVRDGDDHLRPGHRLSHVQDQPHAKFQSYQVSQNDYARFGEFEFPAPSAICWVNLGPRRRPNVPKLNSGERPSASLFEATCAPLDIWIFWTSVYESYESYKAQ